MTKNKLKIGEKAPEFSLPDAQGNKVSLEDSRGTWVVLFFYPKDSTPGCTLEAIGFTGAVQELKNLNAQVVGISPDSCESHTKFILNYSLGITLLSDTETTTLQRYGVWQLKTRYGKESYGVARSTFLIDPSGIIRYIWENVDVKNHVVEVLCTLKELSGQKNCAH
jgi:peroxiredoxin Q/BCP